MTDTGTDSALDYKSVKLPSRGVFYGGALPDGGVEVRPLTVDEESLLFASGGDATEKVHRIIRQCVRFPDGFRISDLLLTDRMAIMLYLRVLSYGPSYNFRWRCPYCNAANVSEVNLADDLKDTTPEDVEATVRRRYSVPDFRVDEPLDVALPSGKSLSIRFLRVSDDRTIQQRVRQGRSKGGAGGLEYVLTIALSVVSIGGREDLRVTEREEWVRRLSARDGMYLRNFRDDAETGIDTTVHPTCSSCNGDADFPLPLDAEFFRPTAVPEGGS